MSSIIGVSINSIVRPIFELNPQQSTRHEETPKLLKSLHSRHKLLVTQSLNRIRRHVIYSTLELLDYLIKCPTHPRGSVFTNRFSISTQRVTRMSAVPGGRRRVGGHYFKGVGSRSTSLNSTCSSL
jgi:hypothetical protein